MRANAWVLPIRVVLAGAPLFTSCGAPVSPPAFGPRMSTAGYDRSCTTQDDCVEVHEGHVCQYACVCPNAAIRRSEQDRYNRDYSRAAGDCPPLPPVGVPCSACPDVARCNAGTCEPIRE